MEQDRSTDVHVQITSARPHHAHQTKPKSLIGPMDIVVFSDILIIFKFIKYNSLNIILIKLKIEQKIFIKMKIIMIDKYF